MTALHFKSDSTLWTAPVFSLARKEDFALILFLVTSLQLDQLMNLQFFRSSLSDTQIYLLKGDCLLSRLSSTNARIIGQQQVMMSTGDNNAQNREGKGLD